MSARTTTRTVRIALPTLSFTLPTLPRKLKKYLSQFQLAVSDTIDNIGDTTRTHSRRFALGWAKLPKFKKRLIFTAAIFTILASIGVIKLRGYLASRQTVAGSSTSSLEINRGFEFALKDAKGNPTDNKLKFTITKVERSKNIIIKGQNAQSVQGRIFLIVNLKLENPTKNSITIRTRDFVRLISSASEDKLAPDIHNDPTEVQAISTKLTRIGFPVEDSTNSFKLFVGEIEGEKQEIELNFSN